MFNLTGLDGPAFRGSLEELMQVERAARTRRGRALEEEGHDPEDGGAGQTARETERYRTAAKAYAAAVEATHDRGPVYHAYQVMSRPVRSLPPDTTVSKAWQQLTGRGVSQAPVVNSSRGIIGLVTAADLLRVLNVDHGRMRDELARTVRDVMRSPVVTSDPVSDVRRVARVMLEFDLPAVPVVDEDEKLVGIVTRNDILRTVVTEPPLTLWA